MFMFTLTSKELGDTYNSADLNRFGMHHMVGAQESHFTVRPPKPGTYQLVIYAKVWWSYSISVVQISS